MNDQLITIETAKLIPDKYNKRALWSFCKWFYIDTTTKLGYYLADVDDLDIDYPAPTQTAMVKWFRENNIYIAVSYIPGKPAYYQCIIKYFDSRNIIQCIEVKGTQYETTLETGLQQALIHINT
jgi:hypothetical protein